MKRFTPAILLACLVCAPLAIRAADPAPAEKPATPVKHGKYKIYTSIKAARKAAAEEKKSVYMLFTGPGWCHFCESLDKEVVSTKEWKTWAEDHVIVYVVPSKGGPGNEQGEGKKLKAEYAAKNGYPTTVVTDAEGKVLGLQPGYSPGTKAFYMKALEGFVASNTK